IELALALIGGLSAPFLFMAFAWIEWFQISLFGLVFVIGTLVGLELPLLMRILKEHLDFNDLVSRALTFDYIGALLAALLFPILLVPQLGLVRTSLVFGTLNALVGLWGTYLLRPILSGKGLAGLRGRAMLVVGILVVGIIKAESFTTIAEEAMLSHPIVYAKQSPYQRIVVTQSQQGFQLYLNGQLQFNSSDEYRYHEALVHPVMSASPAPKHVLVLGGGDGLAVREILKYASVESVTVVDLDPEMTKLAQEFGLLVDLNERSLLDPRVRVINQDAFIWVREATQLFDTAIIDFPDPGNYSIGKLYTTRFYRMLRDHLTDTARIGIQCTSPLVAPHTYWCVINTQRDSGFYAIPNIASVPYIGVWGFAYASMTPSAGRPITLATGVGPLRFLTPGNLNSMFELPSDIQPLDTELNRLNNQVLVRYYDQEWSRSE
ncbi:MAG: polyamine aminopropyltransferase, partial [Novipirellula sp. JB048]